VRETREETGRAFLPDAVTGLYLWQGPAGRMILRIAFAGRVGERDDAAKLDRAIIRTLWLDRIEGLAQAEIWLEIVASDAEVSAAQEALLKLAAELGLKHSERRSYLELLLTTRDAGS
jgi:hypothetical protein